MNTRPPGSRPVRAAWIVLLVVSFRRLGLLYEIGPGKPYAGIGAVAWESLQAGDTVLIYWRTNAYKEKWVLCRQGATNSPITVRGVPGPNGELPLIDGENATTRTNPVLRQGIGAPQTSAYEV